MMKGDDVDHDAGGDDGGDDDDDDDDDGCWMMDDG